jgi:glycosyltransferase involved in cell wall biosynthesis
MKQKIAQFIGTKAVAGAENAMLRIASELKNRDYNSIIIARPYPSLVEAANEMRVPIIPITKELEMCWEGLKGMLPYAFGFANFLKKHRINVLHSHLYKAIIQNALPTKLAGVNHIGTMHDSYTCLEKPSRNYWLKAASLLGTQLTAVSKSVGDACKIQKVIYNGITPPEYTKAKKQTISNSIRFSLGLLPTDFVIITTGRLIKSKRIDLLINAVNMIVSKFHNYSPKEVKLLIAGEGELLPDLERLVDQLALADYVKFLGFRKDIENLLLASDLFVLPSEDEGLSCSVIEAMFASLPVIMYDVGGNRELAKGGAYVLPFSDYPKTLSDAILNCMSSNLCGNLSRISAEENFTIETVTNQYIDLYVK